MVKEGLFKEEPVATRRQCQAQGTTSVKALKQGLAWCFLGIFRGQHGFRRTSKRESGRTESER